MPTINSRCQLTPTHAPGGGIQVDLIKNFFKKMASPGLFFVISFFSTVKSKHLHYNI